jgi:hypothetical protein
MEDGVVSVGVTGLGLAITCGVVDCVDGDRPKAFRGGITRPEKGDCAESEEGIGCVFAAG